MILFSTSPKFVKVLYFCFLVFSFVILVYSLFLSFYFLSFTLLFPSLIKYDIYFLRFCF